MALLVSFTSACLVGHVELHSAHQGDVSTDPCGVSSKDSYNWRGKAHPETAFAVVPEKVNTEGHACIFGS